MQELSARTRASSPSSGVWQICFDWTMAAAQGEPMNIREFRNLTDSALREVGFEPFRLMPRKLWVWAQPACEIVRFFHPHAFRRPWGFVYSGFIGIEIPPLRNWLNRDKPG